MSSKNKLKSAEDNKNIVVSFASDSDDDDDDESKEEETVTFTLTLGLPAATTQVNNVATTISADHDDNETNTNVNRTDNSIKASSQPKECSPLSSEVASNDSTVSADNVTVVKKVKAKKSKVIRADDVDTKLSVGGASEVAESSSDPARTDDIVVKKPKTKKQPKLTTEVDDSEAPIVETNSKKKSKSVADDPNAVNSSNKITSSDEQNSVTLNSDEKDATVKAKPKKKKLSIATQEDAVTAVAESAAAENGEKIVVKKKKVKKVVSLSANNDEDKLEIIQSKDQPTELTIKSNVLVKNNTELTEQQVGNCADTLQETDRIDSKEKFGSNDDQTIETTDIIINVQGVCPGLEDTVKGSTGMEVETASSERVTEKVIKKKKVKKTLPTTEITEVDNSQLDGQNDQIADAIGDTSDIKQLDNVGKVEDVMETYVTKNRDVDMDIRRTTDDEVKEPTVITHDSSADSKEIKLVAEEQLSTTVTDADSVPLPIPDVTASDAIATSSSEAPQAQKEDIHQAPVAVNDNAADSNGAVNEESDFTYRRKSMDDFIKRILAEAREEQQKRMITLSNDNNPVDANVHADDSSSGRDESLLDRRLASTNQKLLNGDQLSSVKPFESDFDNDLAETGRNILKSSRRANKYDYDPDANNRLNSRGYNQLERYGNDDDDVSVTKTSRLDNDGSYVKQHQQPSEESFKPQAREETAEIVRCSVRPVHVVIAQQSDVIQQFKTLSRNMDDLETEVRKLRETCLDRQAQTNTLRSAIDAEYSLYVADLNAANERIEQQKIHRAKLDREDVMASVMATLGFAGKSDRSSAIFNDVNFRGRSGSVSSTVSNDTLTSATSKTLFTPRIPADSYNTYTSDVDDGTSPAGSDYPRSKRGGSVIQDRTYSSDELFGTGSSYKSPYLSRSSLMASDDYTTQPTFSKSSYLSTVHTNYPSTDSTYSWQSTAPSAAGSTYGSTYGSGLSPSRDESKFRRAQSVGLSDTSHGGYSNFGAGSSFGGTNYGSNDQSQSRFVAKQRGNYTRDPGENYSQTADRQFKSRFLQNVSNSDTNKYSLGSAYRGSHY